MWVYATKIPLGTILKRSGLSPGSGFGTIRKSIGLSPGSGFVSVVDIHRPYVTKGDV